MPVCEGLDRVAVLMPAWGPMCGPMLGPDEGMVSLVGALLAAGVGAVVVVDDGSGQESEPVFDAVRRLPRAQVLRHAVNLGKGRALKTGFNHILIGLPEIAGVVTADADGQHSAVDVLRVGSTLAASIAAERCDVVLGVRRFTGAVPVRSRLGNCMTRGVFRALTGTRLGDTQTGLRGFSRALLPSLLRMEGERYEYEMNVLLRLCRRGMVEVPIETLYFDRNGSSRFRPVRDSVRIYGALLRSGLSLRG